ncbi:MAG: murein biosynthesis integral membrane protein MurJ [Actinomycetota bacterium]|nr:murein biosynthesis integral membrane protein MurJ [Actinomycetota bacterium]
MITAATALSRVTGFVRVIVVAAAMGTTFLANTYQTANTAPNIIFELVAAGVLTSVFVPTFVDYLVKGEEEEGWEAANALASAALVVLVLMAVLVALAAPLIMRLLTVGVTDEALRNDEIALGSSFLRLFAPQIVFYGAGMIMTAALHARRRFALPAVAPIFNNIVVIGVYLGYAAMRGDDPPTVGGISGAEVFLLGAGTTAGVVAMTVVLIPQLRRLGWRFAFRVDISHPAVRRGARIGGWALGYAGGYQAGLIVVLLLANKVEGGVAAYQWAYTFFYLPHALVGIPIFHVLFTAMSEHAARKESLEFQDRLGDGLAMLFFLLLPIGAFVLVAAGPLTRLTLQYGVMTDAGAEQVARVLGAFAIGLPTYSAFLVFTRAFYALGDAKTPALVNAVAVAVASAVGAAAFFALPDSYSVAGLALGHSVGFALALWALARRFSARWGDAGGRSLRTAVARAAAMSAVAAAMMAATQAVVPEGGKLASAANVAAVAAAGAVVYLAGMVVLRSPELRRVRRLVVRSSR